ncbi:MAG: hypothetical protein Q9220_007396 [cf. Caloplaca sp. 1 TL-2023]
MHTVSGTDIWRKPPSTNRFDAPYITQTLPLSSLRSARVTVSAQWQQLYDQGGLLLILPGEKGSLRKDWSWIKTGIEFYDGKANISTVACRRWADWSLAPLPEEAKGKVTVEMTREVKDGEKTSTLWVHSIDPISGEKTPLREVTWVFEESNVQSGQECEIGVYSARPSTEDQDLANKVDVTIENLIVETW